MERVPTFSFALQRVQSDAKNDCMRQPPPPPLIWHHTMASCQTPPPPPFPCGPPLRGQNVVTKGGWVIGSFVYVEDWKMWALTGHLCLQVEKLKKQRDIEAYLDDDKAKEAKERGNELFKNNKYPEAIKEYDGVFLRAAVHHDRAETAGQGRGLSIIAVAAVHPGRFFVTPSYFFGHLGAPETTPLPQSNRRRLPSNPCHSLLSVTLQPLPPLRPNPFFLCRIREAPECIDAMVGLWRGAVGCLWVRPLYLSQLLSRM